MSTATEDRPQADGPDATISRTVKALRSALDVDARTLAAHLGIGRASLYSRLNGAAPWQAAEVASLAKFFGCDVGDFFTGRINVETIRTTRRNLPPIRPVLTLIPGGRDASAAGQNRFEAPRHAATAVPPLAATS